MTAELTPVEVLDDAVRDFLSATGEEGVLSGWVLTYQASSFTDDPNYAPLATATDYSMSPSTTGETAIGLLRLTSKRLERVMLSYYEDDEDDD